MCWWLCGAWQGPGAFLQGAGPTAAGYFLGGAIAFGGTEILKRTAIAVLGPQVAIAYSFPVSWAKPRERKKRKERERRTYQLLTD